MKRSKNGQKFPLEIKQGSAVVKIYQTPSRGRDGYTVTYWANRQRKRRSFAQLAEAKTEAQQTAIRLANGDPDLASISRADWSCYIRAKQLADTVNLPLESMAAQFVAAKRALGETPLMRAVDDYVRRHPQELQPRLVKDVIHEMLEAKRQDGLDSKYLLHLRYDLERFAKAFNTGIGTVIGEEIDAWLRGLGVRPRTRNNLRTSVQTLFNYAKAKKYLPKDHDELDAVPRVKEKGEPISIFTPFEMESLLACADESLVAFLALGGFAGIRHAEIQRLTWDEIHFEEKFIEIRAAKAKTASRRTVPLLDNLNKWLLPIRKEHGPVCRYKSVSNEITDLVEKVNRKWKSEQVNATFSWKRNAMRHSFISYRVAKTKNVNQVALEAGNSPQIIFRNYRELVRPADAEEWFSISPKRFRLVSKIYGLIPALEAGRACDTRRFP